ncbi:hypothetical protein Hanom_Chr11g01055581 [Helianthus anomalus]
MCHLDRQFGTCPLQSSSIQHLGSYRPFHSDPNDEALIPHLVTKQSGLLSSTRNEHAVVIKIIYGLIYEYCDIILYRQKIKYK